MRYVDINELAELAYDKGISVEPLIEAARPIALTLAEQMGAELCELAFDLGGLCAGFRAKSADTPLPVELRDIDKWGEWFEDPGGS